MMNPAGLSGEGRSSATTLLVSTALEWMNGSNSGVPEEKRKLLGFTDNRQDAALQAVESKMGAVAWGLWPSLRFPSPLIEPDLRSYQAVHLIC